MPKPNDGANKRFFYASHIYAQPAHWITGQLTPIYLDDDGTFTLWESESLFGYALEETWLDYEDMNTDSLPVEFFNHQLKMVDVDSEESVRGFIRKWGFPFLPFRFNEVWSFEHIYRPSEKLLCRYKDAINKTTKLEEQTLNARSIEDQGIYGEKRSFSGAVLSAISCEEAALCIELLQDAWQDLTECILSDAMPKNQSISFISACLTTARVIEARDELKGMVYGIADAFPSYNGLTAAICGQIVEAFDSPAPWKLCQADGCGTVFKRKQGGSKQSRSDSIYCCPKCQERQKKKNLRKPHIKH